MAGRRDSRRQRTPTAQYALRVVATLTAVTVVAIAAISVVHVYWASGGRRGVYRALPQTVDGRIVRVPGRIGTLAVAAAFAAMAVVVAVRGHIIDSDLGGGRVAGVLGWLVAALFVMRAVGDGRYVGFLKRVRGTPFARADTALYSPLSLAIGLAVCAIEFA